MSNCNILEALRKEKRTRQKESKHYNWLSIARPSQLPPPGKWRIWLILAGRGFGKTRTGAETLRLWIHKGLSRRIALVGETEADVRHVMIEGTSGLLAVHPPSERPLYEPTKQELTWSNGARATCFSAEAYERLRGPQFDSAWVDELAKFKDAQKVWDQVMFGLRLGQFPRAIITTTPRPLPLLKNLLRNQEVTTTKGSTFENATNLATSFLDYVRTHYGQTLLGRQELYADIIESTPESLWSSSLLNAAKEHYQELPLHRVIVAVDPAVTHSQHSDETGIIVAGLTAQGVAVVLKDLSLKGPPSLWINKVIETYHRFNADRVIAEVNMGGDLVEHLLRTYDASISYKAVRATRGKSIRAEPIAALYEQGKVWHADSFPLLESQLLSYIPGKSLFSPDRLDALVWALTELILGPSPPQRRVWNV